jgi:cobalamin synthase
VRLVAGIILADALGRLNAGAEPEDELEIIRDREFGVAGLELWVDVVLAAAESVVELDVA